MPVLGAVMVPHPPVIVPDVGRGYEKKIQLTADSYKKAAALIKEAAPDTIVISSPHNTMYADYFNISKGERASGSLSQFMAPDVRADLKYDVPLVEQICSLADAIDFPAGTMGQKDPQLDHGCLVPLYFILKEYTSFRLVRIGISGLPLADHYRLGMMIREASDLLGRNIFYVASGDLSHKMQQNGPYGFDPAGPVYDEKIMDVMGRAAFGELFDFSPTLCEEAAECGHRSFVMMAGALDRTAVKAERLSHEDITGVGYGVCTYEVTGPDESRDFLDQYRKNELAKLAEKKSDEDGFVRLARRAVEAYVSSGTRLRVPDDIPEDLSTEEKSELLNSRAGVFVSLHSEGNLRGCIGTISPVTGNIASEICGNAVSASSRDPRFSPVKPQELPLLEYSVDVLGDYEDIDSPSQLDPKRYGVIVEKGGRRGLLLPNLDGVNTVSEQISIACRKAGIGENESGIRLKRFEVVRHY